MFGAAVPEATINEDGEGGATENEIGASNERLVATPTSDAVGAENTRELEFGVLVTARADGGHHLGALFLRENVWHRS